MWLKYHPELNRLSPLNYDSVQIYFNEMINKHRASKGLNSVVIDSLLKPVANDQLNYVNKIGKLTHEQNNSIKKYPWDRARFYKVNFDITGENLSVRTFYKNYYYFDMSSKLKSNSISFIYAKEIFEGWKSSLGHNTIMLNSECDKYYFNIKILEVDGQTTIYAITVFGKSK
jgi:uncharacterized protein YkwD